MKERKRSSFALSLSVFIISTLILIYCVVREKQGPYIPLLLSSSVVMLHGAYLRIPWSEMRKSIIDSISESIEAIIIICLIGIITATWIASGTIPTIIYYGFNLFSESFFLPSVMLLCSIMSIITGSSWTTIGTIGLAFLGIGDGLGVPMGMTAGAIICGAYFGDKQSPMSDSTNFAAAVSGTDLYSHTRSMLYTTGPAFLLSLLGFFLIGTFYKGGTADPVQINIIRMGLAERFYLSPVLMLPFIVLLVLIIKRFPAIPTLLIAAGLGMCEAIFLQGESFAAVLRIMYGGFIGDTGIAEVDKLLTRGGMSSMTGTILIMLMSLTLAGLLRSTGVLHDIINKLWKITSKQRGLMITTLISTIMLSFFAADPYLAMLLPANALAERYDKLGIDRSVLSRTIEDGGTIICPMVPWGTNGIYCAATLGVAVGTYLPFYFMGVLTPLASVVCAITGFGVKKKINKSENIKSKA